MRGYTILASGWLDRPCWHGPGQQPVFSSLPVCMHLPPCTAAHSPTPPETSSDRRKHVHRSGPRFESGHCALTRPRRERGPAAQGPLQSSCCKAEHPGRGWGWRGHQSFCPPRALPPVCPSAPLGGCSAAAWWSPPPSSARRDKKRGHQPLSQRQAARGRRNRHRRNGCTQGFCMHSGVSPPPPCAVLCAVRCALCP